MRLRDITPATLGHHAHEHVVERIRDLTTAIDPTAIPAPLDGPSEVRQRVAALAHYAKTGEPPEGRRDLVHEYLVSLIPSGLLPDDPKDPSDTPTGDAVEVAVHTVVLAALARERIADGEGVPVGQLAALASVPKSYVQKLIAGGDLRPWRRVTADERRRLVHPESARRWLEGRAS